MNLKSAQRLLYVFFSLVLPAASTPADTVVLKGKPPFRNVHIVDFEHGRLVFRGVSEELLRKPLSDVVRFKMDRNPMLSNAEALAGSDAEIAITAYRQALADAAEPWLRDLIRVRLLGACDRVGRFDEAVALYAEVLQDQPLLAEGHAPRRPAAPGSAENQNARRHLLAATESNRSRAALTALRTLTLELLLFDGIEPLPPEFTPPASGPVASRPAQPVAASQPGNEPPPLFGPPGKRAGAAPAFPGDEREQTSGALRLPEDSFVLTGAQEAFQAADALRAARLLERAMPYLAEEESHAWRLLLGRCRIELGQIARAADELLALTEFTSNHRLAAEALYYVGVAHERMDRADVATRLYGELLQQADAPAEVRRLAQQGLERLGE